MSDYLGSFLVVAIVGALALAVVGGMLAVGSLLRPKRPQPQKYLTYESGVDPVGDGWSQSQVRYYIFALLFVIFDVETVFLFPWAINADSTELGGLGWFGFVEIAVFTGILIAGLAYLWRKGLLKWA